MTSSVKMLVAGFSAIVFTIALGIYVIVFNPLLTTIVNTFRDNCPPYYWHYLGGDNITWILSFIWILIVLAEILILIRMFSQVGEETQYDTGGW